MLENTSKLALQNFFPIFLENLTQVQLLSSYAGMMKVEGSLGFLMVIVMPQIRYLDL